MPWQLQFQQDTEVLGVGTATATFSTDAGRFVTSHSGRIDSRDDSTIGEFIDQALARYEKAQVQDTEVQSVLVKVQAVLNEKTK